VNQRPFRVRSLSMRGETIREHARDGRPSTRPKHSAGPPRETSAHATPCSKTPYARRKTRTPRPGGQGVHSLPAGAPVSRAPLEVVLDRRRSDAQSPCARVRPRRAVDITRFHAADACSRMPSAFATRAIPCARATSPSARISTAGPLAPVQDSSSPQVSGVHSMLGSVKYRSP
jgi:hypothetical protein